MGRFFFFLRFEFDEMKRVDQIDFNKKKRIDFDRFIFFFSSNRIRKSFGFQVRQLFFLRWNVSLNEERNK